MAQVFLTGRDRADALASIHHALRGGGYLAFETRRPERRAWKGWAADTGVVVRDIPGVGPVQQRREVTAVDLPFVSIRHTYTFAADDVVVVSDSTLRFRECAEIESDLRAHGYRVREVREAPNRPGHEFVFIAEAARSANTTSCHRHLRVMREITCHPTIAERWHDRNAA